ncbi:hypothetical protein CDD81_1364 [Ophiocordyceps australis]|uniref:Uncharacterized protein n=1 Tax=Ophiocordyceps australis TaxID=1399860 RepID=A0A2C5XFG1_9HYPO|nr:hypothetical protein CDD81_1364 [Ophiocordyceps australis]
MNNQAFDDDDDGLGLMGDFSASQFIYGEDDFENMNNLAQWAAPNHQLNAATGGTNLPNDGQGENVLDDDPLGLLDLNANPQPVVDNQYEANENNQNFMDPVNNAAQAFPNNLENLDQPGAQQQYDFGADIDPQLLFPELANIPLNNDQNQVALGNDDMQLFFDNQNLEALEFLDFGQNQQPGYGVQDGNNNDNGQPSGGFDPILSAPGDGNPQNNGQGEPQAFNNQGNEQNQQQYGAIENYAAGMNNDNDPLMQSLQEDNPVGMGQVERNNEAANDFPAQQPGNNIDDDPLMQFFQEDDPVGFEQVEGNNQAANDFPAQQPGTNADNDPLMQFLQEDNPLPMTMLLSRRGTMPITP